MTTTRPIMQATAAVEARATAPIVLAFAGDPAMRWLYPEPQRYLAHFPALVTTLGGRAFDCGTAFSTEEFSATALWLPPDVTPSEEELVGLLEASVPVERLEPLMTVLQRLDDYRPETPCWYLPFIGVDPRRQGKGHGSALLAEGLARCDDEHAPAYLETSNPRNVPLYERHGFRVAGEVQAGDSPVLWPMVRDAR